MANSNTRRQPQRPRTTSDIPPELSFEEIIKNRTISPCSLNDFMDYLFYIERSAENLQFFLWYWDYVQRWSTLLPRQKALSPPWDPEKSTGPPSRFIKYSHKRERSLKMSKVIAIMEMESDLGLGARGPRDKEILGHLSSASSVSRPWTPPPSVVLSPTDSTPSKADWQPFTIPPFRDELTRIVRHYISPSPSPFPSSASTSFSSTISLSPSSSSPSRSPRQLPLPARDLQCCLLASQHTTHPSSLLPAFLVADSALRGRSHRHFLRFARRNANDARVLFLRILGGILVVLGFVLDTVLILSGRSAYWRVGCLGAWWTGLVVLFAARKGVCVGLWGRGRRLVRVWEVDLEGEGGEEGEGDMKGEVWKGMEVQGEDGDRAGAEEKEIEGGYREHRRKDTASTSLSSVSRSTTTAGRGDTLRQARFQAFGPANDFSEEPWVKLYSERGFWRRVFDETVPVQNKGIVLMQDRVVLLAVLWGGAVATGLTVVSLFVPSGRLFW